MTPYGLHPRDEVERRVKAIDDAGGSLTAAAKALGIDRKSLKRTLVAAERYYGIKPAVKYVVKGVSELCNADGEVMQFWEKTKMAGRPDEETIQMPDPKRIIKRSTLYDQQGQVQQQWITEKPEDVERERLWEVTAAEMARETPRAAPIDAPSHAHADLCACYPVGDHHIGMYAWNAETGADYDLAIAERLLADAMDHLVASAPPSKTALVAVLGIFSITIRPKRLRRHIAIC